MFDLVGLVFLVILAVAFYGAEIDTASAAYDAEMAIAGHASTGRVTGEYSPSESESESGPRYVNPDAIVFGFEEDVAVALENCGYRRSFVGLCLAFPRKMDGLILK